MPLSKALKTVLLASLLVLLSPQAQARSLVVKTSRRILWQLTAATGVSLGDPKVATAVATARSRFPTAGSLDELTPSLLLSMVSVTGTFCRRMDEEVSAEKPADAAWAESMATRFWKRRPTETERESILAAGQLDEKAPVAAQRIAMCTAAATALEFLLE